MTQISRAIIFFILGFALIEFAIYWDSISPKVILSIIVVAIGLFVIFLPYDKSIKLLFFYMGFEGFLKVITHYNPIIHVGADLLIVSLVARFIIEGIFSGKIIRAELPPLTALFGLHWLWFLIAVLNPYALSVIASLAAMKLYVTVLFLYFFGFYLTKDKESIEGFFMPWLIVAGVQSAVSLFQAVAGTTTNFMYTSAYVEQQARYMGLENRPFGLTAQPGAPAIHIYLLGAILLYYFLQGSSFFKKILAVFVLLIGSAAMMVCQVRSAMLKAFVSFLCLALYSTVNFRKFSSKNRQQIFGFLTSATVVLTIALPMIIASLVSSSKGNAAAIERSMTLFDIKKVAGARSGAVDRFLRYLDLSFWGSGLSRIGSAAGVFEKEAQMNPYFKKVIFFSDNFWVAVQVDLGLPGCILVTLLIFSTIFLGIKNIFQTRSFDYALIQVTIISGLISVVVGLYGSEGLLYNPEAAFFWFFSGVLMKIPFLEQEKDRITESDFRLVHFEELRSSI